METTMRGLTVTYTNYPVTFLSSLLHGLSTPVSALPCPLLPALACPTPSASDTSPLPLLARVRIDQDRLELTDSVLPFPISPSPFAVALNVMVSFRWAVMSSSDPSVAIV
jgi:hypothetical protein